MRLPCAGQPDDGVGSSPDTCASTSRRRRPSGERGSLAAGADHEMVPLTAGSSCAGSAPGAARRSARRLADARGRADAASGHATPITGVARLPERGSPPRRLGPGHRHTPALMTGEASMTNQTPRTSLAGRAPKSSAAPTRDASRGCGTIFRRQAADARHVPRRAALPARAAPAAQSRDPRLGRGVRLRV